MPQELIPTYDTCFLVSLPTFIDEENALDEIRKTANQLKRIYVQKKLKEVAGEIQQYEKDGNDDEAKSLQKQYSTLTKMLE